MLFSTDSGVCFFKRLALNAGLATAFVRIFCDARFSLGEKGANYLTGKPNAKQGQTKRQKPRANQR